MNNQELVTRGVAEVIDATHLLNRLEKGRPLRVKFGIDPSKPEIHIGHAVPLRKLREFQEAGHTAILLIGDYTAQLGDPSDKTNARQLLSAEETKKNSEIILKQAFKLLDKSKTEIRRNSEWFHDFTFRDVLELLAHSTLNQLLSHETFQQRLDQQLPLQTQEIIYPLMQGYDSVMLKADLELGGVDQKFNLLMGRIMQRAYNQPEQDVMLFPYLPGTDGQAKMSKSLNNAINLTDSAEEMFGKTMSIPDELILPYFELATFVPEEAIASIKQELSSSLTNPRDIKRELARQIATIYHGTAAASQAEEQFIAQFQKGQLPDDIKTKKLAGSYKTTILALLASELVTSNSEARRLIEQGGVKIDGQTVADGLATVKLKKGMIIQVGKRRFVKVG